MASAQKRGFRLPWGGDAPQDDLDGDGAAAAVADPDAQLRDPGEAEGSDDDHDGDAFDRPDEAVESRLAAVGGGRRERAATEAASDEAATDTAVSEAKPPAGTRPGITAGWPDTDRRQDEAARGRAGVAAVPAPVRPPAAPRRDNPLVAGLLRAMREAATVARDETIAGYRTEVTARVEAVRTEGAAAAANLRTTADNDIVAIREWGKAEMARIRQETEVRIAERREQLSAETDAQAESTEAMLGVLRQAVSEFETDMAAFFENLVAENDPARLAGLAERMPMPPSLEAFPEPDAAPARGKASRNGRTPSAEEAAPTEPEADAESDAPATDQRRERRPAAESTQAPAQHGDAIAAAGDERDDAHLDSDAAAAAEAEAIAGLALPPVPTQSQLVVVGLATVPAIAAFKAELMQIDGVTGVNVTAGADGEFMFTVAHAGETDLRAALDAMDRFAPRVTNEDDASLFVAVEEPEA